MASNTGRVEIKFLTDTKEIEAAKRSITDLEKNIDSALKASASDDVSKAFHSMGSEAETASDKVDDVTTSVEKLGSETSQLSSTNNGLEEMAREADTTASKVDEVTTSVDKLDSEVSQLSGNNSGLDTMGDEADSTAVKVDNVTESVDRLGNETSQLGNDTDLGGLPNTIEQVGDKADRSTGGVRNLVSALGLLKVGAMALNMVMSSVDDAIGRVDTMRQYPKMVQQMGFEAEVADKSIDRLADGIQGLPTRLNDVVSTTQRFTTAFRDVDRATETTLALNNALLASGASGQAASNATDQYVKVMSSGKLEMDSWNTLSETMNYGLVETAKNMGFADGNVWALYDSLKSGEKTLDEFNDALIETSNQSGGFAEVALTASEGIATSFTNIRTAVVNGVSKVIEALDALVEDLTGKNIAKNFDDIKVTVSSTFSTVANSIRNSTPYIRSAISIMRQLTPVITGVATAYGTLRVIRNIEGWIETANKAISAANIAKKGLTLVTRAMTTEEIASQGALTASQAIYAAVTSKTNALKIAKQGLASVTTFLTTPIGWLVVGLGLAAGAFVWLKKSANEASAELGETAEELDKVNSSVGDAISSVEASAEAYDKQIKSITANKDEMIALTNELEKLMGVEEKTTMEKEALLAIIDRLNGQYADLNLSYDDEAKKLNKSTDAIRDKIKAQEGQEKANAIVERYLELLEEQSSLEQQLIDNADALQRARDARDSYTGSKLGEGYKELTNTLDVAKQQYTELNGLYAENQAELQGLEAVYAESMANMATVTEESTGRQIIALEQLSEEQQNVVSELQGYYTGLKDHTQNMFDEINDTIMTTTDAGDEVAKTSEQIFAEMQATLEHNQQVVATWADNMANLAQRGVDEGLLNELSRLGPEGAPYVQALVDASDAELASLSDTFAKGGDAALEALQDSLGLEDFELEGLEGIITRAETTLAEEIENSGLNEIGGTIVEKIGEGITEADTAPISEAVGTTIIEKIPEWIESGSEGASEAGKNIVGKIGEGIQSSDGLQEPINTVLGQLPELFTGKNEAMQEAGKNLMDGAKMGVDANKGQLSESTETAATEALDGFKSASGVASPSTLYAQAAADIVAGAVQGIVQNKETLTSSTRTMAQEAVQAFIQGSSGAYSAGQQLGRGFQNGLASMRNSIVNTAIGIANAASAAINKALDVRSPSRKGIYSGSMLGKGVYLGMEGEKSSIEQMADTLGKSAIPDMKPIDIQTALDMPYFRSANNSPTSATGKASNDSKLAELLTRIADKDTYIVLDDGTLVGKIAPKIDREIGNIAKNKARYGGA